MPLPAGGNTRVSWGDFSATEQVDHTLSPPDELSLAHTYQVRGTYALVVTVRDVVGQTVASSVRVFIATGPSAPRARWGDDAATWGDLAISWTGREA